MSTFSCAFMLILFTNLVDLFFFFFFFEKGYNNGELEEAIRSNSMIDSFLPSIFLFTEIAARMFKNWFV